ncbi:MAG: protein translocase subunit SecF [Alphaproteobacteria bacterium]|nr:protein translocase subunit SecF [Alphaproteobacteria bacterium]MCL2889788.1 protein translocase subunit SecF [Alphaproteobacteria bacterium]
MQLKFMKYRKLSYAILVGLMTLSILSLVFRGLNYGIDFSGGISMEVKSTNPEYTIDRMRSDLAELSPELQEFQDTGTILIRIGMTKDSTEEKQNLIVSEIKTVLGDHVTYEQVQIVGPKIGGELIRGGILAVLFAFILMAVYIWIRYRGGYAVSSLISLVSDFVIMFGFFSLVGLEFNQTSIAVILMGLGYSTNDKVVNFDRIEENVKKYHKMPTANLIDLSINEMMRRTIITNMTTMLCMLGLYLFAGSVLRDFSLAMMFAIILGTLTSIFVSNSLLLNFNIRGENSKQ